MKLKTTLNKEYQLVSESSYGSGYGNYKTAPEKRMVIVPDSSSERLVLINNDSFLVTTLLENFKLWVPSFVGSKSKALTALYQQHCLENLKLVNTNLYTFPYNLPYGHMYKGYSFLKRIIRYVLSPKKLIHRKAFLFRDEICFTMFVKYVINHSAFSIWDKELNAYAQEIEFYQTKDKPAPACGNKRDCFACNGKEFYFYVTLIY